MEHVTWNGVMGMNEMDQRSEVWSDGVVTVDEGRVLLTGGQKSSCMSTTSSAGRKSGVQTSWWSAMTAAEPVAAYFWRDLTECKSGETSVSVCLVFRVPGHEASRPTCHVEDSCGNGIMGWRGTPIR